MTALDDTIDALLECVRVALAATDAGEPGRVCDVPGLVAADDCQCGQLTITIDRIYPSLQFPNEAPATALADQCTPPYEAYNLTVTVLRCAPTLDSRGNPPSCAVLDAAALAWFIDMDAVREALGCCLIGLRDADTIVDFTLRDTTPLGPDGACVGSDTHLTIGLVNCGCLAGV